MSANKKNNKYPNQKKENEDLALSEDNDELNSSNSGSDKGVSIKIYPLKIGFVGDPLAGKTCIIKRFMTNQFEETACTVSSYFVSKKLKIDRFNEADLKYGILLVLKNIFL